MSDLSVYFWIKNNQRGATTLRKTVNTRTDKTYYYALVRVNGVERMTRITKDEYAVINDRYGNKRDCFVTREKNGFIYNDHCVQFN
jgi:hypothetical protein